jgi:hypothetical protein
MNLNSPVYECFIPKRAKTTKLKYVFRNDSKLETEIIKQMLSYNRINF